MKKNKITFVLLSIIFYCFFTTLTYAVIYAPTGNSLQPMPADVVPNISGNINSTSTHNPTYQYISDLPTKKTEAESKIIVSKNEVTKKNQSPIWYWLIFIIIISIGLFWGFLKLYPSRNK